MATKKKVETIEAVTVAEETLKPEEAVKFQKNCAKCGANLALTGYVENNYKRFCSPGCAS